MAAHGKLKELVVLLIATRLDPSVHIDPFRLTRQSGKKASNVFLVDVAAEPFPAQHLVKLGERRERNQNFTPLKRDMERSPRH
jgi:hypothetical protein